MVYGRRPRFRAGFAELGGLLHPWQCLCCGAPGEVGLDLCVGCHAELPWLAGAGANLAPPFAAAWVPFRYAFPVDRLVIGLKFAAKLERARLLGTLLGEWLAPRLVGASRPAALLPVPLHAVRIRSRGFNQAAEIARPVAKRLDLPLVLDAVQRVRATAEQTLLDAAARRANLAGAFVVRASLPAHIAILDDVVTTGATVGALAEALHDAGVARVTLLAVARAL